MNGEKGWERVDFEEIGSTNDYLKSRRGEGKDILVTAKRQTGGRGTKGRSFESACGGVYLSLLRHYQDFPAKEAFKVMAGAAVAVCEVLKGYGLRPVVKWPNDIHVNGKKICGILIENSFSGAKMASSIVGVGLNVCNRLDGELLEIATTMEMETGKTFSVCEIAQQLAAELMKNRTMDEYRAYLGYMGAEAVLIIGNERVPATLISVDNEGNLLAKAQGETQRFSAAEVSLRF